MLLFQQNPVVRLIHRSGQWASLAVILVLVGWSSQAHAQTPTPTPADTISPEEVRRYARAGLMIEEARRKLQEEIGRDRIQGLSCQEVSNMRAIDAAIVQSCQKFSEFVSNSELDQNRFNLIYQQHQQDIPLAQRILTEMARLCIETEDSLAASFCQDTVRVQMQRQCNANPDTTPAEICDRLRQPISEN